MFERTSGVLMHITSLPSPYGIGTMGADARAAAWPYWLWRVTLPVFFGGGWKPAAH